MESPEISPTRFFVYGTLQRGEVRARHWPRPPLQVEVAYTLAKLHDLGPYPAITEGTDRVRGELWTLAAEDLPATLQVLDAVEGFNQGTVDWYVRRVVACHTIDGLEHHAYCYFWGRQHDISHTPQVPPDAQGYCDWKQYRQNLALNSNRHLLSRSKETHP